MTKDMVEDLLHTITLWLEDLEDIQINGHQIDENYTKLEAEATNIELDINGLKQNIRNIDKQLAVVMECHLGKGTDKLIV
ncbi:hypothetical protein CIL05_04540 [Virgibacillus profundi]|uniref:Uncharacterized protein n=1 Tax=Virgibacillus profundi TaxID=2024555 RepID=A0A2A2IIR2_9BACI|nr:hypothetical protein [Virgibacillus profundi]PAV30985.1 hypothetical protein CIL05_04540 [Virgibacillus profundi]PXY55170.1 hypothetical protein CIT14_04625 [Virgibacillus profundi]